MRGEPAIVLTSAVGVNAVNRFWSPHMTEPGNLVMPLNADDRAPNDATFSAVNVILDDILKTYAFVTEDIPWHAAANMFAAGAPDNPDVFIKFSGREVTLDIPRHAELNIFMAGAPVNPEVFMKFSGREVTLDIPRHAELNIFAAGAPVSPAVFRKFSGSEVTEDIP